MPAIFSLTAGRGEGSITTRRLRDSGGGGRAGRPRRPGGKPRGAHLERRILDRRRIEFRDPAGRQDPRHYLDNDSGKNNV